MRPFRSPSATPPHSRSLRTAGRLVAGLPDLLPVAAAALVVEGGLRLGDPRLPRRVRVTLPALTRWLGVRLDLDGDPNLSGPSDGTAAAPDLPPWAARRAVAVDRVFRRWPGGDTCLRRALVLGRRLAPLHPTLRLGALAAPDGELTGHAWLEVDGRPLGEPAAGFVRHGEL